MPTTARLTWDAAADRKYEYGVSQGVLYPTNDQGVYGNGVAWNGLTNITDQPEGADLNKMYADGIMYAGIRGAEEYHASIQGYTYPDEFAACDGSAQPLPGMYLGQQNRKKFGLSWRTEIGNANTETLGYKIHVAYGLTAAPTEKSHDTVNESPEAADLSWDCEGTPVPVPGYKPTAKLEFDSAKLGAAKMAKLEELLYGSDGTYEYQEFTGSAFVYGQQYYERTGTEGAYEYVLTQDTSKQTGKTYYTKTTTGGAAATLPTPAEILAALQAVA